MKSMHFEIAAASAYQIVRLTAAFKVIRFHQGSFKAHIAMAHRWITQGH